MPDSNMEEISEIKQTNPAFSKAAGSYLFKPLKFFRNGMAFYWASFFILIPIEFFLGGQMSVLLSKQNYSIYVNVLNTIPFYNVLANLGISYSIIYIISYNRDIRYNLFGQAIRLQTIWYVILVIIHLLLFYCFSTILSGTLLITVIITFTYLYRQNITSFFLATKAFGKAALSNMIQKSTLVVAFYLIHFNMWFRQMLNDRFLIIYPLIEFAVVALYIVFFTRTNYLSLRASKIKYSKRLIKYGKYAMLNHGLNVLYYTIIAIIIRYSNIELHLQIILGLCIIFFRYTVVTIAPMFSIMSPQLTLIKNDHERVQAMYRKYLVLVSVVSVAMLLVCRFFLSFFITRFYAPSYHDLPLFFNFFCYLIPLLFLNSLNGAFMAALGKIKFTAVVEIICTLILASFFIYNLFTPIGDYTMFYYIILIHLSVKCLLLHYGTYTTIKNN